MSRHSQRAVAALVIGAFLLVLSEGFGAPASAQEATSQSAPAAEEAYGFAFQNAEIAQVAQEIFGSLGVKYTIDPSASGRVSFRIEQRLTKPQLLQAFETALAAHNLALVQSGDALLVTSAAKAKSAAVVRPVAEGVRRAGYDVVAVPLSFAVPSEVAKALEAITGPGIVLYANDRMALLVLGGSGQQLQSALESIRVFDQNGLDGARIRWFELAQAPAAQVASELGDLIEAAGVSGVRVAALKRLNGVILFGNTDLALNQVASWIPRLDAPTKDSVASLWVYRPKNTSSEALARTLNAITGSQSSAEQAAAAPSSSSRRQADADARPALQTSSIAREASDEDTVRAAVDKETNTLLISAPAWRWVQLQRILAEIDRPQPQLLIEATILEVVLSKEFRLGVDWSVLSQEGRLTASSVNNVSGRIGPSFPGLSITFIDVDVQAAIAALGSKSTVEVISAPKIVTLDNHPARLQVGDEVPIVRQTAQSSNAGDTPIINSVEYRNSGVILNVTPRVSGEDRVTLEIAQEVSSVARTVTSGIDSPTIQQRKLESTLVLWDGAVVALGGLISRTRDLGNSGVPYLKDIPGLGSLFRESTRNEGRTELIVLLKVTIIHDSAASTAAMTDFLRDLKEINARGLLNAR